MAISTFLIWASLVSAAFGSVVKIAPCENNDIEKCTIDEVRIVPCANPTRCRFKQGINVTMDFDFTPNFASNNLKTGVYWQDQPFTGLGSDNACDYTACPTEPGKQQVFSYGLPIGRKLPAGQFTFKWIVSNEDNRDEQCCFTTNIQIIRKANAQ